MFIPMKDGLSMTVETFKKIYEEIICGYKKDLEEICQNERKKSIVYSDRRAKKIFPYYEKKRRYIRRYFMKDVRLPIDRHKIGAIMMYAILKSSPFKIKNIDIYYYISVYRKSPVFYAERISKYTGANYECEG